MPFMSRKVADGITLADVTFSQSSIRAAIRKLKPNISSGPDGFPPLLYKKLEHCIAVPLSLLFTSFMSVGCVTQAWTHARVTPVYKGGSSSYLSNYRPISLTCVACKIME